VSPRRRSPTKATPQAPHAVAGDGPPTVVPELMFVRDEDPAAATLPDLFAYTPRLWTDRDGTVCAYGHSHAGQHLMDVPGTGRFYFAEHQTEPVTVVVDGDADLRLLNDVYLRMVVPMVLQVRGREVLHASAVLTPAGVVALCAVSRTGKSTVAYAWSLRGYGLWADDVIALDVADRSVSVLPLPFRIRLMPDSAALLMERALIVAKQALGDLLVADGVAPLAAILLLEREDPGGNVERIIPPTRAFPTLLSHAYSFTVESDDRRRTTLERYLRVTARVPIFKVSVPTGLANLEVLLDRMEASLADAGLESP
jgi:hypothetical protein